MSFRSFLDWLGSPGESSGARDSEKTKGGDWKEKRRSSRVDLEADKQLVVHLLSPEARGSATTLVARVKNISLRGCHLLFQTPDNARKARAGQVFVASLAVEDFPIPLQVEVVRAVGDLEVAIRFKPPFPRELEKLEKFLEPRCLGLSMREIDSSTLQMSDRKELRWFQGVNDTHLFSWLDPETGDVLQQQLVFLEKVVEWQKDGPMRTGKTKEEASTPTGDYGWVKSELLDFDEAPNKALLTRARTLIESAKIDSKIKGAFLKRVSMDMKQGNHG